VVVPVKSNFKFPICTLTVDEVKNYKPRLVIKRQITMEEYYTIEDAINSLERLRQYQWQDFLGRYKIF